MPTIAQIKQFLTLTVLPVLSGSAADWLVVHLHFLAAFHITALSVAGEITQLGVFGIGVGISWLASHHILKGTYKPPKPLAAKVIYRDVPAPSSGGFSSGGVVPSPPNK